jgi:hypothetical protein
VHAHGEGDLQFGAHAVGARDQHRLAPALAVELEERPERAHTEAPVKTQFGWHVIKVEEMRDSRPPTFEEAKDQLEHEASRDIVTEVVNDLRGKAKIARFNADGTPKTEGEDKKGGGENKKP